GRLAEAAVLAVHDLHADPQVRALPGDDRGAALLLPGAVHALTKKRTPQRPLVRFCGDGQPALLRARLAAVLRAAVPFAPVLRAAGRALRAICADSSSIRAFSASTSFADGTPSFCIALAVRSSKIDSSLSHCLPARAAASSAMLVILLVTSLMRSSAAACVFCCRFAPSLTSASKRCLP